jgi:DNA-dependent RNA polymerase auxiliary subunit epsilon
MTIGPAMFILDAEGVERKVKMCIEHNLSYNIEEISPEQGRHLQSFNEST